MKKLFHEDSLPIRFLTLLCDLMLLNLMYVFSALTIVLSGAGLTALYSQTLKMVRREEESTVKGYLRAVKENFLQSFPATLLLFFAVLVLMLIRYALRAEVLVFAPPVFVLLCILLVLMAAFLSWLFPLTARYETSFGKQCKNAMRLAVTQLPQTFLMVFVNLLPLLIGYRFPAAAGCLIGIWLLIGCAAGAYINSWYLRRCFDMIEEQRRT